MSKIVFAIPTNTSGGAERVLSQIANYAAEKGHETFWVNYDKNSDFYQIHSRVNIVKLNISFNTSNKIIKWISSPIIEFRRFVAVNAFLKKEKPDVVIAFLKTSEIIFGLNCILLKIPFITSIRNDYNVYGGALKVFRKLAYPKIQKVVCQTKTVQESLDKHISCDSIVIPNPTAPEAVAETDYIGKKRSEKIICVGRLCEQKNFELLIDSMKDVYENNGSLRKYKVEIYGDGADRQKLQNLINDNKLSDSIELMGVVTNTIAKNNDAALYVMSSNYEGFPNTLAEAMANGIPSITTDFPSGAGRELVGENIRGRIVPVGDKEALAEAITYMLLNTENADQMAIRAKDYMKQFQKEPVCEKWMKTILSV